MKGLEMSYKEPEVMAIDGIKLKQQSFFSYLVAHITQDGTSHSEINLRIVHTKDNKSKR